MMTDLLALVATSVLLYLSLHLALKMLSVPFGQQVYVHFDRLYLHEYLFVLRFLNPIVLNACCLVTVQLSTLAATSYVTR